MNSTGIYSMLSSFFLVVILVFIVLTLVYINLLVVSHESTVFQGIKPFELASDVKNKIIELPQCFDGKIDSAKLAAAVDLNECGEKIKELSQGQVAGFSVERMQHLDCNSLKKSAGDFNNCSQRFVFFVNVGENYKNCLGKMTICMAMKK
jgi:hypothetical protein